jgi:hypothetical protein
VKLRGDASSLCNERLLVYKMVNCDHRDIVRKAHHLSRAGAGQRRKLGGYVAACFPIALLRSDLMLNLLATNETKYQERAHSGARPDSEGSKQPALPGTPSTSYSEKPALHEPPYEPYAEKPKKDAPYEPYKGI